MAKRRHTPEQVIKKLGEAEVAMAEGGTVAEAARRIGVAEQTFYRWRNEYGVSERRACRVLGHPRSTQRYKPIPAEDEKALTAEIVELASQFGRYGYCRITAFLRQRGRHVNHKRVERIRRYEGLKVPAKQPKRGRLWPDDGACVRLQPAWKDHAWAYDFVCLRLHDGTEVRLLTETDQSVSEF